MHTHTHAHTHARAHTHTHTHTHTRTHARTHTHTHTHTHNITTIEMILMPLVPYSFDNYYEQSFKSPLTCSPKASFVSAYFSFIQTKRKTGSFHRYVRTLHSVNHLWPFSLYCVYACSYSETCLVRTSEGT